jgi:hypothetical protein
MFFKVAANVLAFGEEADLEVQMFLFAQMFSFAQKLN